MEMPTMPRQKVLVGVSDKLLDEFDTVAEKLNKTRSEMIRDAMRFYLTYRSKIDLLMEKIDTQGEQPANSGQV
jgi:metal-responsive CopG/Arc/MetJ family transcriptional regulator